MNINTRAKALIGAVAIGGAAIAMGGAFTAGGLSLSDTTPADTFVGGTDTVSITGATLDSIDYQVNADATLIDAVVLTLIGAPDGSTVDMTVNSTAYTCGAVAGNVATCDGGTTPQSSASTTVLDIVVFGPNATVSPA